MKTFNLNRWMALAFLVGLTSGCDLNSLRGGVGTPIEASPNTSTTASYGGSGSGAGASGGSTYGGGTYGGGGSYDNGTYAGNSANVGGMDKDFGGKSSKKYGHQSGSWPSDSYPSSGQVSDHDSSGYPSNPSYPSSPSHPSYPSSPSYPSDHSGSSNSGHSGSGHAMVARTQAPQPHSEAAVAISNSGASGSRDIHPVSETCSREENPSVDPRQICLGIRYVSYRDGRDESVESELDAIRDMVFANQIWRSCGIQFQMDRYESVRPQEYQLRYRTRNYEELNQIRGTFAQPGELLVVATGAWDRSGSLGNNWANAWTNLPGEKFAGVVLEQSVSNYPQILAHELGHYLSLDHSEDPRSLMYPIVGRLSTELTREECRAARWAAKSYWREMMR